VSIASLTPTPARFIDPRGQRFGAGVSAVVLVVAFLLSLPWLAALVGLNLLVSAAFGTRLFLPGRAWPFIKRALKLGPTEPEHEYPPRFAQAMGGTFLALATVAFVLGFAPLGWLLVGAVAALQTVLAATGVCIGCRMYFLRWWVPSQFARFARRTDTLRPQSVPAIQRVK
jgi:hypothetical protein